MPVTLPVVPLLHAFRARCKPKSFPRADWLRADFLDAASDQLLADQLLTFYRAAVPLPLHAAPLVRRVRRVRHGLNHLLRGADPLPVKVERCLGTDAPYAVSGLGPAFWSALRRHPR